MAQIIPKFHVQVEAHWQKELAQAFTDPAALLTYLQLEPESYRADAEARRLFPLRVPRPFAALIQKGDAHDPLLRQVLTSRQEFDTTPGFSADPVGEQQGLVPGLLHKYRSRALLIVRGGCAVNCRYCFRRHFPYSENHLNRAGWQQALGYLAQDERINEVILSGGDPLMAKDDFLAWLVQEIAQIPHVRRLRVHTRLPVVIPARLTPEMLGWLTETGLQAVLVLHANHANEISTSLAQRLTEFAHAGVTLLNQSVLLQGVNDNADALAELSEALFAAKVLPYYLHQLDRVLGAAHFDVGEDRAIAVMAELIKRLPGFLVPKLVREIQGQPGKTPIDLNLP